jgi:hypothetical protein
MVVEVLLLAVAPYYPRGKAWLRCGAVLSDVSDTAEWQESKVQLSATVACRAVPKIDDFLGRAVPALEVNNLRWMPKQGTALPKALTSPG